MLALIVASVLAHGSGVFYDDANGSCLPLSGGTITGTTTFGTGSRLHLNDDILASYGNTSAAPDVWCEWDTGANPDEFACTSTDVDGGGTDGVIIAMPAGSRTLAVRADLNMNDAAGRELVFAVDNDAVTPSITLEPGTGWYGSTDGRIHAAHQGSASWQIDSTQIVHVTSGSGMIKGVAVGLTTPTLAPNGADAGGNSGFGGGEDTITTVVGGIAALTVSESTDTLVSVAGGFKVASKTADPCADTTNYPIGTIFYNSTSNVHCFCGAASADLRMVDNTTACF